MGKIYAFYSPQRGAGLTTLLVTIGEWLAARTELTVGLLDFTSRPDNTRLLNCTGLTLSAFLAGSDLQFPPERPVAISDLKPDEEDSFKALQKAQTAFDLAFVDLSNRLDQIAHQVLELSHRVILVAPGTELVVRYFKNMLEMSRLLERNQAKQVNLLLSRVRHHNDVAILTDEIKNRMMGFVLDRPDEESIQRAAENFYYDYYLQKLSDERQEHLQQAIAHFTKRLEPADSEQVGGQLWVATESLDLPYNKRILLFRWLVLRARLGQPLSLAAEELLPRFIAEDFECLAKDLSIETETLGPLLLAREHITPA